MSFYEGYSRQAGGGLGGIFKVLARSLIPAIARTAKPFLKSQAKKALPHIARAGLGLVGDLSSKKNFKQAIKARSKRLAGDVIMDTLNSSIPPAKRQRRARSRNVNILKRRQPQNRRKKNPPRDVFS